MFPEESFSTCRTPLSSYSSKWMKSYQSSSRHPSESWSVYPHSHRSNPEDGSRASETSSPSESCASKATAVPFAVPAQL